MGAAMAAATVCRTDSGTCRLPFTAAAACSCYTRAVMLAASEPLPAACAARGRQPTEPPLSLFGATARSLPLRHRHSRLACRLPSSFAKQPNDGVEQVGAGESVGGVLPTVQC